LTKMEVELQKCHNYLKQKDKEWESLCLRCGACCGAFDDPCLHLKKDKKDKFFCSIYSQRFGIRKTANGEVFQCVPIKKILSTPWKRDYNCPYKKSLK